MCPGVKLLLAEQRFLNFIYTFMNKGESGAPEMVTDSQNSHRNESVCAKVGFFSILQKEFC